MRPTANGNTVKDIETNLLHETDDKRIPKDNQIDNKPEPQHQKVNDTTFAENLRGKLLSNSPIEERINSETVRTGNPEHTAIDTDTMYTFADLVQQLDEQDEREDGDINSDEIEYDYDAFENDEKEEDEDEENNIPLVPGIAAQNSFLDQIRKLRASKLQQIEPEKKIEEDIDEEKQSEITEAKSKSILKSTVKEDDISKSKKRVGFASELEVHEVESFKEETKKQTHNFPRPGLSMFCLLYTSRCV